MQLPHTKHKHASFRKNQDPFSRRIMNDPYLDWKIMLGITTILAIGFIWFGVSSYVDVERRLSADVGQNAGNFKAVFSPETLKQTLKKFDDRATESAAILRGVGVTGDPSR